MTEPRTIDIHITIGIYDDYTSNPDQFIHDLTNYLTNHDSVHTIALDTNPPLAPSAPQD